MRLEAGCRVKLLVDREVSPYGYFLTNGVHDVLLHYSELVGDIEPGQDLEVFLFHDTEDRLAASMKSSKLQYQELGRLEVVDSHPRLGCFLDIGLGRNLLLPLSELPELPELRPQVGDEVFVIMERDKQGRMIARLAQEPELLEKSFSAPQNWVNQTVDCLVYKTLKIGSFVVCGSGLLGFGAIGMIHESERIRPLRVGARLEARVTFVRPDGRVNLSMRPAKEKGREDHAEAILAYLQGRSEGAMPYSDQTPSEVIKDKFKISKSAFKRALGKLMKEEKIEQKDSWTYLKK